MKSLSLFSVIEYLLAASLIIVETALLIQFYYYNMSGNFNDLQYLYFMNEIYEERFYYCLYKATDNPYYLFYIPSPNYFNNFNKSQVEYIYNCNSQSTYQFLNLTSNKTINNEDILTYEEINTTLIPVYVFFSANDMSNNYVFSNQLMEIFINKYGEEQAARAAQDFWDSLVAIFTFQFQSAESDLQSASQSEYQALQSLYAESEINSYKGIQNYDLFENFYANLSKSPNQSGYLFLPISAPTLLSVDLNGNLYQYSIYDFGYISAQQCTETIYENILKQCYQYAQNTSDIKQAEKCFKQAIQNSC